MSEIEQRLRTKQAAAYCGLSEIWLRKLRIAGGGPVFERISSRAVVYPISELEKWLTARRCRSTSAPGGGR